MEAFYDRGFDPNFSEAPSSLDLKKLHIDPTRKPISAQIKLNPDEYNPMAQAYNSVVFRDEIDIPTIFRLREPCRPEIVLSGNVLPLL